MRVVLCYAPPWKLPLPGARADFGRDGPPAEYRDGDLDGDFYQLPYGLLALGAQALRAGHAVKVLNLSAFPWAEVERVVRALPADVWGFSAWTANRRGVALMADLVKRTHPAAHVVVGGPHATPLAPELLRHYPQIDSVVTGEGDVTFLELLGRVGAGEGVAGVPGTVARRGAEIVAGPRRRNVENLDELASPQDYFSTHILMTSRGCPWQCTFCGAETTWGRGFRGLSVPAVLDAIEQALERLPVRMLQIKDDTFTANRKRVLELCAGIRARELKFLWSCDTRVDVLTADLLREMRLAGCERLSLGVESGSDEVLERIHKRITRQEILEATRLARRFGIRVRYYMMLGNRGETAETFRQTLDFLDQARPDQYLFSCLSIYPGTLDFDDAEREGWLSREQYFEGDFQELKVPFDASPEVTAELSRWFEANKGLRTVHVPGVDECRAVLAELGDHPPALAELGGALHRAGELAGADAAFARALELGHPTPGVLLGARAAIALSRGDVPAAEAWLRAALRQDPMHVVVAENARAFHAFLRAGGPGVAPPPELRVATEFQLLERTLQPTLPGPLPDDFADWSSLEAGGIRLASRAARPAYAADQGRRLLPMVGA